MINMQTSISGVLNIYMVSKNNDVLKKGGRSKVASSVPVKLILTIF